MQIPPSTNTAHREQSEQCGKLQHLCSKEARFPACLTAKGKAGSREHSPSRLLCKATCFKSNLQGDQRGKAQILIDKDRHGLVQISRISTQSSRKEFVVLRLSVCNHGFLQVSKISKGSSNRQAGFLHCPGHKWHELEFTPCLVCMWWAQTQGCHLGNPLKSRNVELTGHWPGSNH